jgi:hypothetical protein
MYVSRLPAGKIALWCYLAWYLATVALYFDPRPSIWLNSLGISAIVGAGLLLSVNRGPATDRWQIFRLFMMPFGVSSFSALIKGQGFFLVFAPAPRDLLVQVGACALVLAVVFVLRAVVATTPSAAPDDASTQTPLRGAA